MEGVKDLQLRLGGHCGSLLVSTSSSRFGFYRNEQENADRFDPGD